MPAGAGRWLDWAAWAIHILQRVHQNDGIYNAFPSGPVYQTALICLFYNRLYPDHPGFRISTMVIVALPALSTP